jgi:phage terminase small subunit
MTPKQESFAQQVASGKSLTEAYRQAYPKSQKWKLEALYVSASQLADAPKVSIRIKELQLASAAEAKISDAKTLKEIACIAFFDPRKLFNEDETVKFIHELDDSTAAALASFELNKVGKPTKVKVFDKNSALEKLCKHLGLYEKDNTQRGQVAVTLTDGERVSRLAAILSKIHPGNESG